MGATFVFEPIHHCYEVVGHRRKGFNLLAFGGYGASYDALLMNVKSRTMAVNDMHWFALSFYGLIIEGWCNNHIGVILPCVLPKK